ncbi:Cerevisin [Dactylellina cionopaga]|nr:Cerevisin [Dactylellina cionopaga]
MKSINFISSPLLFSLTAIPVIFAAPVLRAVTPAADLDPHDNYMVLLAEHEKRPWKEVFATIGINATETTSFDPSSYGKLAKLNSWETEDGGTITSSGTHIRVFSLKMKRSQSISISSLANVAAVDVVRPISHSVDLDLGRVSQKVERRQQDFNPYQGQQDPNAYQAPQDPASYTGQQEQQTASPTPQDSTVYPGSQNQSPYQGPQDNSGQQNATTQQDNAPWNLQRISAGSKIQAHSQVTSLDYTYRYMQGDGAGVDVYILDGGLNYQHTDFGGRAQVLWSYAQDGGQDIKGHGSHTAGTVGSNTYGVAKAANLWGVKILGDGASGVTVIQGIDAALANHNQRKDTPGFKGSVMSMSFSDVGDYAAEFEAIKRATDAGVHIAVSAGNTNKDACTRRPARYSKDLPIITVGASDINDLRMNLKDDYGSNYGDCVTIHAPGVDIMSTFNTGPDSTSSMSGTSMAAPAVAGMIAVELSRSSAMMLDPQAMKEYLVSQALPNAVTDTNGGTALINNGFKE